MFIMQQTHSSKSKIALFGGTFNPPTMAHKKVIEDVLKSGIVDNVWVLPSLGKFKKSSLPYAHRMAMCNLAFGDMENVSISSLELALGEETGGYTANIIDGARKTFPHVDFYFIIGADTALKVKKVWYKGRELSEDIKFITLPRLKNSNTNYINEDDWYRKEPHIYLENITPTNISSTQVRNIYSEFDISEVDYHLRELIDKDVAKYIDEYGFYEGADKWEDRLKLKKAKTDLF